MKFVYIFLFFFTLTIHMDTACMLIRAARLQRFTQQRKIQPIPVQWRSYNGGHPLEGTFPIERIERLEKERLEREQLARERLERRIIELEHNAREDFRNLLQQMDILKKRMGELEKNEKEDAQCLQNISNLLQHVREDSRNLQNQFNLFQQGIIKTPPKRAHLNEQHSFIPEHNMHYRNPTQPKE